MRDNRFMLAVIGLVLVTDFADIDRVLKNAVKRATATGTDLFELRLSEVDPAKAVYQIIINGKTYVAQGEPVRDQHGLVLRIEAYRNSIGVFRS